MSKWTKIAAIVLATIAIVLLAYAILTEEPATETTGPGMGDGHIYTSENLIVMVISSFLIAVAVMFLIMKEEYVPLPPLTNLPKAPPPAEETAVEAERAEEEKAAEPEETQHTPDDDAKEYYLVLRLLTGDERTMFKNLMDSGGEALQKDLMARTKMSNAKVSRVLDRLEQKGVITKDRHGSTNKIKILLER
ncbi:MAG TPA: hypothetical protein VMY17_02015 [Thermoplasmata archaeon]|jgi:uncharacterized membrane protein|nr:hypothetical protein [Thermoplasmata archaeon]